MKTKWSLQILVAAGLAFAPMFAVQAAPSQDKSDDKSDDVRNITGCLSKGDSAKEFKVTGADGSTWEVTSATVKLSPHLGHTVTVTGKVWHPDMHGAKEKAKETVDADAKEHGHLKATNLEMVSESCKK
jgi:hypothetical protein